MVKANRAAAWLASYPPDVPATLDAGYPLLPALLEQAAREVPTQTCLRFMGAESDYATVMHQVHAMAATLAASGVKKGCRVGICLPNCPLAVVAYHATLRLGAVVVNLNPLYTEDELAFQLRDSTPAVVITTNLAVMLPKLLALHAKGLVPKLMVDDFTSHLPFHLRWGMRLFQRGKLHTVPLAHGVGPLTLLPPRRAPTRRVTADDLAVLQYTGGTTGMPKAAMLSHGALAANVRQIQMWLGPPPAEGDTFLAVLPLFHCFAMTVAMNLALANRARIILVPQFNLRHVLKALSRGVTLLPAVPTLLNALATSPLAKPKHFSSLRFAIAGGAPLAPEVRERFEALARCRVMEGYGLTEASPVATCNPRHKPNKSGSAGIPLPSTEVTIVNPETGAAVPAGEVGEIRVRGPQLMDGYWNNPAATREVLAHGWLTTGDLGFMDAEGYLHLTDRIKDIILVNGYNVYPRVIEEALYAHPAVAEVMVIGHPDTKRGEVPVAYVVLKHGANATADGLLHYAQGKLNALERPHAVVLRESLPKTLVGKLSKKDLRASVFGQK